MSDDLVYSAGGVRIIDVSNPSLPSRRESWDGGAGGLWILRYTPAADLVVTTCTFAPQRGKPGDEVAISLQVRNAYKGPAAVSWAHIYLSADRALSRDDFLWVAGILVPDLPPNAVFDYATIAPIPHLRRGGYYVLVECDVLDQVAELDESNNVLDAAALSIAVPDLVVESGTIPSSDVSPYEVVQVATRLRNGGDALADASWAHVYLSRDPTLTADDHLWLSGILVPTLAPGEVYDYATTTTVPCLPSGSYHVLVQCDVLNAVLESNEADNVRDVGILSILPGADLVVRSGSVQPVLRLPGQEVEVTLRVENVGVCSGGPAWTHIYLSSDRKFDDPGDLLWIQGIWIPVLGPGQGHDYSTIAAVPASLDAAQWQVIAYCDITNAAVESNEQNNWRRIGVVLVPSRAGRWSLYR